MKHAIKRKDLEQLAEYREQLCLHPKLTWLFLELTDACNLKCLHCGSCASPENRTFLPLEQIRKVLERVAETEDSSRITVCLTGGEPLLHPDFYEIVSCAVSLGFSCGITTNATLIDEEAARKMVRCGIGSVSVSLDGIRESHDWFRSAPGSYDRAVKGIRNLVQTLPGQMVTQVTTVVHKKNLHQLEQMYARIRELGVDSWRLVNLEPIGRALQHSELLLSGEEWKTLLSFIREYRYDIRVPVDVTFGCAHYLTTEYEREVRDHYFLCGSGIYVGSVLCNGDIYSCLDIQRRPELVQGNVYRDDFMDIWYNRFREFRRDRTDDCEDCRSCADRRFCRGDAAHTWDYEKKQPLLCPKQLWANREDGL